jgi:hypothetical protein
LVSKILEAEWAAALRFLSDHFRHNRADLLEVKELIGPHQTQAGPPREVFETTAVPEIRAQAQALARRLMLPD